MIPRPLLALSVVLLLAAGSATAATHDPTADRYVGACDRGPAKQVLPVDTVEAITYTVMPEIHARIEKNTGREVTFSYVHVCVGGDCMAVDPFRFNR